MRACARARVRMFVRKVLDNLFWRAESANPSFLRKAVPLPIFPFFQTLFLYVFVVGVKWGTTLTARFCGERSDVVLVEVFGGISGCIQMSFLGSILVPVRFDLDECRTRVRA